MSPRELRREFALATARREDREQRDVVLAWSMAMFSRQQKLPALAGLLERAKRMVTRRTPKAQRTELALLGEHLGVNVQPISEAAKRALARLTERHGE